MCVCACVRTYFHLCVSIAIFSLFYMGLFYFIAVCVCFSSYFVRCVIYPCFILLLYIKYVICIVMLCDYVKYVSKRD